MVSTRADRRWRTPLPALLRRWRREESGATAIEFAIIGLPFVLLLFGLVSVCLYYFADFSMENATWQATRAVRTGQLQQSTGAYSSAVTNADRQKALKKAFCDRAFLFTDCNTKAVVIVQSNVRGRDLGSFATEVQRAVQRRVSLPDGYFVTYGGQFENQQRAMQRLSLIVPAVSP
jgi:Flp pilus assembly protein TadG